VVEAYDKILHCPEPIRTPLNIGTGQEVTIKDLAYKIIRICGKDFEPVFDKPRMAEVDRLVTDATKAKILLNWEAKISIDEGLKRFVDWFRVYGFERQFE
jgi:nucleoside-diphosphate-sugar epimerase